MIEKIICFFKGHKRGYTKYLGKHIYLDTWRIKCSRCGYTITYDSPRTRLVGTEIAHGFDGN